MDTQLLTTKFERMGARLKVASAVRDKVGLDIRSDQRGEFFDIQLGVIYEARIDVLDLQPRDRHLLLMVREGRLRSKFLCGHDERHWFVAAIPEQAAVGTVTQAMEALKPAAVQEAQARQHVPGKARRRRKNAAYRRQGEWFFLPMPELVVNPKLVLHNEPLRRGGGKAHFMEFCFRSGGETVYVSRRHPNGVTTEEYERLVRNDPRLKKLPWQQMRRNPGVYVKGRVRHADHATIVLHGWHQVVMNTETQARAMQQVAFLD